METVTEAEEAEADSFLSRLARLEEQVRDTRRAVSNHEDRLGKNEQVVSLLNHYLSENAPDESAPL